MLLTTEKKKKRKREDLAVQHGISVLGNNATWDSDTQCV
jgi:hypothetical protein